jgi:uncharacterized membrane protein YfcA
MLGFTAVAVAGILVGTHLVRYVSQRMLKQAFAIFLVIMGTFILVKNRKVFATHSVIPQERAQRASVGTYRAKHVAGYGAGKVGPDIRYAHAG